MERSQGHEAVRGSGQQVRAADEQAPLARGVRPYRKPAVHEVGTLDQMQGHGRHHHDAHNGHYHD